MTLNEKFKIILGAFLSPRYGVSPSAPRGTVENYSRKHGLAGPDFSETIEAAISAGLISIGSDSSFSIREAGRTKLARR